MKIKINNFKSIIQSEVELEENKVNFFIGANESGKTNLFESIRSMDFESGFPIGAHITKSDGTTEIKNQPNIIIEKDGKINLIDEKSFTYWPFESEYKKKYNKLVSKFDFDAIKNKINESVALGQMPSEDKIVLEKILDDIKSLKYISQELWAKLTSKFPDQTKPLNDAARDTIIDLPVIRYTEPIIMAKEEQKDKYAYKDLRQSDSLIRNIFEAFLSSTTAKDLDKLMATEGNVDEVEATILRDQIFRNVNEKIKEEFSKYLNISAYPSFIYQAGEIILKIEKKSNDVAIDSFRENDRSLGFKSFLRIILEVKSLVTKNINAFYIIDELEQSLHPLLQEEIMKILTQEIAKARNLTLIISTHSPYILSFANKISSINLVKRNFGEIDALPIGATYIQKLNKSIFIELLREYFNSYGEAVKTQNHYSVKLIIDSLMAVGNIEQAKKDFEKASNIDDILSLWFIKQIQE